MFNEEFFIFIYKNRVLTMYKECDMYVKHIIYVVKGRWELYSSVGIHILKAS